MIFQSAMIKELAIAAIATFLALLGIVLSTLLVRLLGDAANGLITSLGVVALLAFTLISFLPSLLSVSLFVAVMMTLSRSYRDSEMVVWFSCGLGLTRWIRPVLTFAIPSTLIIAFISFWLSPWAAGRADEFREQMKGRNDVVQIRPGVFHESRSTDRVYLVEEVAGRDNLVANVFVSSTQDHKPSVVVAESGFQERAANGDQFLVLKGGRRYEGAPGDPEYQISEFERFAIRIETADVKLLSPSTKATPTLDLLLAPTMPHWAELSWRLGMPLSALILCLLAIPLAFVNPRSGRSLNIVLALAVYMIYNNFLSIAQAWISQSKVHLMVGMSGVHLVMLLLLALLFMRRSVVFSWRRWL
jgi:lipopolysaccharide export system permease protein